MNKLRLHPKAKEEYLGALKWYLERSRQAAIGFDAEYNRLIELCLENPLLFPAYDRRARYAVMDRYPYSLIYEPCDSELVLVAVAHSSRRPGYWRRRT